MSEESFVVLEERGHDSPITLNRPKALNALSVGMIRDITRPSARSVRLKT